MSSLELTGIAILVALFLSTPFVYRLIVRPSIGRERRYRSWYYRLAQTYTPNDYRLSAQYREEMIVWFDDPITENFYGKARALRQLLKEAGRKPNEAVVIWRYLLEKRPSIALCLGADKLLETYDNDMELIGLTKDTR